MRIAPCQQCGRAPREAPLAGAVVPGVVVEVAVDSGATELDDFEPPASCAGNGHRRGTHE
jgi:hypothetical protein